MRQLALDIRLADHAVFETYFPGANALAVASARQAAAGAGLRVIWLCGPADTGKTHLLQASVAAAHARGAVTAYMPLADLRRLSPDVLGGLEASDLVALDDVAAVAADADWERGLFRLYEGLAARGGRVLLAGESAPGQSGFSLADLASRFASGAVFRLERMTDDDCLHALQRRAAWRGLLLPDDTGRFLLARVERGTGSLFQLLDRLDRAALEAQKRLTIPFVRSVLESGP